jgi:glycosyltransferase involved in cell wall biosynthesis
MTAGVPDARIAVVPNVMDVDRLAFDAEARREIRAELGIPAEAFVVGCVSRLNIKKPIDVLVRAAASLRPDTHLVIAGDGETEAELRALAAPLGARAHFLPTPHRAIAELLSALDVSVFCPSPTEGEPRAVIYAMLAGRPVVATGREGVADMIVPGTGTIVAPEHDPAAVAEVLRAYEADRDRVVTEGAAARQVAVERYDGRPVAARVEALLRGAG